MNYERKANRGNTSDNHRSAPTDEVLIVNRMLQPLVENGRYFWVQFKGVASRDLNNNSLPFAYPDEGTVMGHGKNYKFEIDGGVVNDNIRYLTHPPAQLLPHIVYESLLGRMKEKNASQANNVAVHYPKHHIKYLTGQFQAKKDKSGNQLQPQYNLVLCHVVWKKKFEP